MGSKVLIVDDQPGTRRVLSSELEDAGFHVIVAANGAEGWRRFCDHEPELVITDMVMPRSDGIELLTRIRSRSDVPVILFSAHGSIESAVTALKAGADDFVSSADFEDADFAALVKDVLRRSASDDDRTDLAQRIVGQSKAMRRVRERVAGLAPLWTPVLISGEPGTGRDAVANALHDLGSTAGTPLRCIDASSYATRDPVPRSGAIYLDNVHRLTRDAQRAWAHRITASESAGPSDRVRVLASTSGPLSARVREGSFDQGLGRLLLRFEISILPLRERSGDIPELARHLAAFYGRSLGRRRVQLSSDSIAFLRDQRWSRNVAQLASVIERSVAFCRQPEIPRRLVEAVLADLEDDLTSIRKLQDDHEREALLDAIRKTSGNVTRTAEMLGKSRAAVYRLIEKHGVRLRGA